MGGGFARLLPLPHHSICLFNPSHYPGPGPGSSKYDPAPLIAGGGCLVLPTKRVGVASREGPPLNGAGPTQRPRLP